MTITNNIQPAIWIHRSRDLPSEDNIVKTVLPPQYDFYFKIYFPLLFENEETGQSKQVRYHEISALTKIPFDENFCNTIFPDYITPFITTSAEVDYEMIDRMIAHLGENESCIFHGIGEGENLPEEYKDPWMVEGNLKDLPKVVAHLNQFAKLEIVHWPNYIFPINKSWCMGNIIPQSGMVLLGCGAKTATTIRNQTDIEFQELTVEKEYYKFIK